MRSGLDNPVILKCGMVLEGWAQLWSQMLAFTLTLKLASLSQGFTDCLQFTRGELTVLDLERLDCTGDIYQPVPIQNGPWPVEHCVFAKYNRLPLSKGLHWRELPWIAQLHRRGFGHGSVLCYLHANGLHVWGLPVLRLHQCWLQKRQGSRRWVVLCGLWKYWMLLSTRRRTDQLPFYTMPWASGQLHSIVRTFGRVHSVRACWMR